MQGPSQNFIMCPCWLCVVLIIWLVDTVCLPVQLAYKLQFISLQAIILVPLLSISLLRLAPSTVYYIYGTGTLGLFSKIKFFETRVGLFIN